jgi:hypothetical protein
MRAIIVMLAIVLSSVVARADRPVTQEERASIAAVLEAEGCSGGEYEYEDDDDEAYEVDDARCADGTYDFELSRDFRILERDRDD